MTDVIPEQQAVDLDKLVGEASVGTDELDEASSRRPSRRPRIRSVVPSAGRGRCPRTVRALGPTETCSAPRGPGTGVSVALIAVEGSAG